MDETGIIMTGFTEYEKHFVEAIKDKQLLLSLAKIKEATQLIWSNDPPRIVQNYIDFGREHTERMIIYAKNILDFNEGQPLTQIENYSLLASIYLHDIGMQCNLIEWPEIKDIAEKIGAKFDFEIRSRTLGEYSIEEQTMIRRNHNFLVSAWIQYSYTTGDTILGSAAKTIPSNLIDDLREICFFHSRYPIKDCPAKFMHYDDRKQLVAAILRFSDELDIGRNDPDILKKFRLPSYNVLYLWLNALTKVSFKDRSIVISVVLHPEDAKEVGNFLHENVIKRFSTVNQPIINVLKLNQIFITISNESGIIEDINAERLPENIIKMMLKTGPVLNSSEEGLSKCIATEGPSTHIATDRWASEDTLGYHAYAYAIYRFMTHPKTYCPLTISIQAPWGGGKTSLMRMIQRHLDPTAIQDVKQSDPVPIGSISIGQVLDEIKYWGENKRTRDLPQANIAPTLGDKPHKLTIWFNAWKYQSTKEVWAGLADAIIHQISARLSPMEREEFWLRLNLKRIDADKIRQQIYERIINYAWQKSLPWLLGLFVVLLISLGVAIMGILNQSIELQSFGGLFALLSLLGGGGLIKAKVEEAKKTIEGEPAAISLSQYLQMPNYQSEIGFIHQVEADLRLVFESIPIKYRPMVVFIDDLDRCLPQKISEVVEGINLFLAGDFPDCMFVIGMDTEMVAAALNSAHAQVLSCMPTDAIVPIGWRFMDKFVQLPFIIPPSESANLERYLSSLLSFNNQIAADQDISRLIDEISPKVHDLKGVESETSGVMEKNGISKDQLNLLKEKLAESVIFHNLDKGIQSFNDENAEICRLISTCASEFSNNPRDIKRFVNAFRFQYFLRWARLAQEIEVVSLDQLQRWIVLMMKWPDVVRWIQHGGRYISKVEDTTNRTIYQNRLKQIETIGETATNLEIWQKNALEILNLDKEKFPWLKDDVLRQFFYRENNMYPEGKRLSDGAGKGLW